MTEKKICTRCGYMRHNRDSLMVPDDECPKCGIVYHKFENSMLAFDLVISEKKMKRSRRKRDQKTGYMFIFLVLFSTLFFMGFISGRVYTKLEIIRSQQNVVLNR